MGAFREALDVQQDSMAGRGVRDLEVIANPSASIAAATKQADPFPVNLPEGRPAVRPGTFGPAALLQDATYRPGGTRIPRRKRVVVPNPARLPTTGRPANHHARLRSSATWHEVAAAAGRSLRVVRIPLGAVDGGSESSVNAARLGRSDRSERRSEPPTGLLSDMATRTKPLARRTLRVA